jgi:hypothetical protein
MQFKAHFPLPFFFLFAGVIMFLLYAPLFTKKETPVPQAPQIARMDPITDFGSFCKRVTATRIACQHVRVDCRIWQNRKPQDFITQANYCNSDPAKINDKAARGYVPLFDSYAPAICCFPLATPAQ